MSLIFWIGIIVGIVGILWILRWLAQGRQYNDKSTRLDGKVVIITGCNTGIGKETVLELARRGARIYMACRDFKRCEEARVDVVNQTNNQNVFNRSLDLASLESIRKFVEDFLEEETRLDILINNAGVMAIPRCETKDGFEMQIGTNHMGHFLLTNLLLDRLKKSAPSRIINISSVAHRVGRINRKDLNSEKSYNRWNGYFQSKLANILFTRELSKRLHGTGVTANSVHPGVIRTELSRHMSFILIIALQPVYFFSKTPRSGAQTTLMVALDPKFDNTSGNYYANCEFSNETEAARDDDTADWLWNTSEEWTGLKPAATMVLNEV